MFNRAELRQTDSDREPRTMQFLVERACPNASAESVDRLLELGVPHVIWVELPDEYRIFKATWCGGKAFPVTAPDREWAARELDVVNVGAAVCEHMGHLIE